MHQGLSGPEISVTLSTVLPLCRRLVSYAHQSRGAGSYIIRKGNRATIATRSTPPEYSVPNLQKSHKHVPRLVWSLAATAHSVRFQVRAWDHFQRWLHVRATRRRRCNDVWWLVFVSSRPLVAGVTNNHRAQVLDERGRRRSPSRYALDVLLPPTC